MQGLWVSHLASLYFGPEGELQTFGSSYQLSRKGDSGDNPEGKRSHPRVQKYLEVLARLCFWSALVRLRRPSVKCQKRPSFK